MDDAFEKLKRKHQNSVGNIIEWMKESKIIDSSQRAESDALKLFQDVKDASNVELDKFKQALAKIAAKQRKSVDDLARRLSEGAPKLINDLQEEAKEAVAAGISAAKEAWKK